MFHGAVDFSSIVQEQKISTLLPFFDYLRRVKRCAIFFLMINATKPILPSHENVLLI